MSELKLRPYQDALVKDAAIKIKEGKKRIIVQAPTGAGKTIIFCFIANKLLDQEKKVIILVHRKELVEQTMKTLLTKFYINAQPIIAGVKHISDSNIYVGMAETVYNRIEDPMLSNFDYVIIDEAHNDSFRKLIEDLKGNPTVLGFSATPLSASKTNPLKNTYEDIAVGPQIQSLINEGSLSIPVEYATSDAEAQSEISRMKKNRFGDFQEKEMSKLFSQGKYIQSLADAYEKVEGVKGTKTIIFNVGIEHSLLVKDELEKRGYNVRHVDGTTKKTVREEIFKWFKETPDAILCNVGIATMGFDEPTIRTVIVNRATTSLPLWLQMVGRGSRITENKSTFNVIDLGSNTIRLGAWKSDRDWKDIFFNPPKKGDGVAPLKDCPQCEASIPASTKTCEYCGYEFKAEQNEFEENFFESLKLVSEPIDVELLIAEVESARSREYRGAFLAIERVFYKFIENFNQQPEEMLFTENVKNRLLDEACDITERWYRARKKGKRYNKKWHDEKIVIPKIKELLINNNIEIEYDYENINI